MRAAIAGTGFMGTTHAEALARIGVQVTGISGSSFGKADAAARALQLPKGYRSYEELLADTNVEAVHITTPNNLHFPMARDALQAGKHVLCEKPLAMNSRESEALVELAATSDRVSAVNYNVRYYPLCLEAASRVQHGDLGKVHGLVGRYVQDWLLYPTDYNWRVRADVGGKLRVVADIGTHWVDLVCAITGLRVTAVCADLSTVHAQRFKPTGEVETFAIKHPDGNAKTETLEVDTEDQASIMLRFDNGARGLLWVSQMTAGRKNHLEFEISGARSTLAWNSESPNTLWQGFRDRSNEVLTKDPALLDDQARRHASYPGGHVEGYPDTFKQCFRAFYDCIAQQKKSVPMLPTFADGHREIRLCEAILKSQTDRCWVNVD
jgi:predicted dehydrogenase